MFRSTVMSPLTVHFQFPDTTSALSLTLFPLSLCFNLFRLWKKTTAWASAQPSSAIPPPHSSWKLNSCNDHLRAATATAQGVQPHQLQSLGHVTLHRVTPLPGSKKRPSGKWTVINKRCPRWFVLYLDHSGKGETGNRAQNQYSRFPWVPCLAFLLHTGLWI